MRAAIHFIQVGTHRSLPAVAWGRPWIRIKKDPRGVDAAARRPYLEKRARTITKRRAGLLQI